MSPRDRSWLRPAFSPVGAPAAEAGWPELDPRRCLARFGARDIEFSRAEYAVLELLVAHPRVLITREELSVHGWHEPLTSTDRVTSTVKRIRQRLARAGVDADQLVTIHALGYRWDPRPEAAVADARSA
jgi:two-component system response regulator MprA